MKNLLILISLLVVAQVSFSQIELPSAGDTTVISIMLKNGAFYSGQLIDRNENEIMLMDGDQTHTLSIDEIEKVTKGQELRRVRITLKDGTERKGLLFKESDSEVAIKNENGQLFLDRDQIAKIERDYAKEFVRIRMEDGTVYEGYRNAEDKNSHTVHTSNGRVMYDPKRVVEIRVVDESKAEYFDHPYSTRYFFTPTAIPMRKGKGYYSNQNLFLNSYHYGLSDNVSIGGGFEIISTLFALTPTPFAHVKVSFSASDNFHYGGGLLAGVIFGQLFNESFSYALPYGLITFGNEDINLSFGGGAGAVYGETVSYLSLSGTVRVNRRLGFISSNFVAIDYSEGDSGFFGVQGVRIMGKSVSVDLALAFTPGALDAGVIIPFVGFGIKI